MASTEAPTRPPIESLEAAARLQGLPPITKLVVAIHGIGSQIRGDTIRSVARQFGDREHLPVLPLGFFHISGMGEAVFSRVDAPSGSKMREIGFVEVFWADIPRKIVTAEDILEETKAWGRTVVSRAQATYSTVKNGELEAQDFDVGIGVIEEVIESVAVLENLCFLAEKAGFFKFDIAKLLQDYVGDVQVVAEFGQFREQIVFRFHKGMADVVTHFKTRKPPLKVPEIYIVAHSEGTVVSFLAMLQALSVSEVRDPDRDANRSEPVSTEWIEHVRGFMTLGSPIDKHLLLWPKMWSAFTLNRPLPRPIPWRNYYDFGDPVGFRLDTARAYLSAKACTAFDFKKQHDFGFSRYRLPGKAHVDYWNDAVVFGHFIDDVVLINQVAPHELPPAPADKPFVSTISVGFPYLLAFLLHVGAVFALYKGIANFFPLDAAFISAVLEVGLLSLLLTGITIAARIPRLTKTKLFSWKFRWRLLAIAAYAIPAALCYLWLPEPAAEFIGGAFGDLHETLKMELAEFGRLTLVFVAGILALTGWIAPRWRNWGRRVLVFAGFVAAASILILQIIRTQPEVPLWPTVLACAAFLYLWWLGILLFDLTFVWDRYIRKSVAIEALDDWSRGWDARPNTLMGAGPPAQPADRTAPEAARWQ